MSTLVAILSLGLAQGALYALIALGYTMVYGIIELINFAHGDVFMVGAFLSLLLLQAVFGSTVSTLTGISLAAAILLALAMAMVACGVLGVVIERFAYRPLRRAPRLAPLVTAIGVSFILENRTRIGRAMRATAQDAEAAVMMGVDRDRVIAMTFFIGSALAGAAGVVYGMYINSIDWHIGFGAGLKAFTAAVLGGIGNIRGAMLGGLAIGLLEALVSQQGSGAGIQWAETAVFSVLILVLVFKPTGLLGAQVVEKA